MTKHKTKSDNQKRSNNRREMGISWRLFGALLIFIAFILVVIWVFQVALLNSFYKQTKMKELETTDIGLSEHLGDIPRLQDRVNDFSAEYDECIRIFTIQNGMAVEITRNECRSNGCLIHNVGYNVLEDYVNAAASSENGVYIDSLKSNVVHPDSKSKDVNTVYTAIKEKNGERYIIMLNSNHIPLRATTNTLEMQYSWIAFVLLIGALVVAWSISKSVCKPLREMSKSAEKLAKGDYNAHFKGGNYLESQELAAALNYAASELSKVDSLQKELVANVSHDLRTPLTMIKGYSEVMRDIPGENTPENVQVIIDETERLTQLVNDMLDISKIRSGARRPEFEVFNFTQTVKEVMTRYVKLTEHDGYNVTFDFDREIYVLADRVMILQAVYNLINNAINYTGSDKYVHVVQSHGGGKVRLSVSDTGEGIKEEDLPLVWDRYYKVDKVHKRAMVGTGLGLSIVKGVLEAHNASYGIDSKVGEGSTFWFELDIEKCEYISIEE